LPRQKEEGRDLHVDTNLIPYRPALLAADARRLRIVVVSEVRFLREGLAEILEREPSVSVVGLCTNLADAVALSPALQPDLVLLDAAFPDDAAAVTRGPPDRTGSPHRRLRGQGDGGGYHRLGAGGGDRLCPEHRRPL
jgi:hypothetical protein